MKTNISQKIYKRKKKKKKKYIWSWIKHATPAQLPFPETHSNTQQMLVTSNDEHRWKVKKKRIWTRTEMKFGDVFARITSNFAKPIFNWEAKKTSLVSVKCFVNGSQKLIWFGVGFCWFFSWFYCCFCVMFFLVFFYQYQRKFKCAFIFCLSDSRLIFAWFLLVFCLFFSLIFAWFLLVFACIFLLIFACFLLVFFFKNQLQAQIRFRLVDYGYQAAFKKLIRSKLNIHKGVGGSQTGKGPHLGTSVFMGGESTSPWEHWSFWRRGGIPSEVEFV